MEQQELAQRRHDTRVVTSVSWPQPCSPLSLCRGRVSAPDRALALPQVSSLQSSAEGWMRAGQEAEGCPGRQGLPGLRACAPEMQAARSGPARLAQGNLVLGRSLLALRGCVRMSWRR